VSYQAPIAALHCFQHLCQSCLLFVVVRQPGIYVRSIITNLDFLGKHFVTTLFSLTSTVATFFSRSSSFIVPFLTFFCIQSHARTAYHKNQVSVQILKLYCNYNVFLLISLLNRKLLLYKRQVNISSTFPLLCWTDLKC